MTLKRLRPLPPINKLHEIYPTPHDHRIYGRGHGERVDATVKLGKTLTSEERTLIADLSCGNGEIAKRIAETDAVLHLGDFAGLVNNPTSGKTVVGAIEDTIQEIPYVNVFICSETLEHLDDPLTVLKNIRDKANRLILSTPLECWEDSNREHLWAWDKDGIEDLLQQSGWASTNFISVDSREYGETYLYGIWTAA